MNRATPLSRVALNIVVRELDEKRFPHQRFLIILRWCVYHITIPKTDEGSRPDPEGVFSVN
jgi:hypothetical protein